MIGTDVIIALPALALAVAVGLVVHEWTHAIVLRCFGIDHTISYFPKRTDGLAGLLASCPWAVVQPHPTGTEPAFHLRAAALAPMLLAVPVFAIGASNVVAPGSPVVMAMAIGWLACSIPSPQDFSVVFYAHRVLETEIETGTETPDPNTAPPVSRAD